MVQNHRENRVTSEFQTRFTERDGGVFFELDEPSGPGTVSLSSGPHKTLEEARAAGAKIVREILRRRIQASGIGRRGERPAFGFADQLCVYCGQLIPGPGVPQPGGNVAHQSCDEDAAERADLATPAPVLVGAAALEPKATWVAPPTLRRVFLEDLAELALGHDPLHAPALEDEQLCVCGHTDGHHMLGANGCTFEPCKCGEFAAAPSVEAVQ